MSTTHKNVEDQEHVDDPLVGMTETTDSPTEAARTSPEEMVHEAPPHGRSQHKRKTAALLGVFLGWLGAHRFYLGFHTIGALIAGLTLGTALIGFVIALASDAGFAGAALVAYGVAALGGFWGLTEGVLIAFGVLDRDADDRPLVE